MGKGAQRRWRAAKDKREPGQYAAFPMCCYRHENYVRLSIYAKALLHELVSQYNGSNNGDLCCAWGAVKDRGLGCKQSVEKARDELELTGWIVHTRQGWKNTPNLYALTFYDVDECGGKLDAHVPVDRRLSYWRRGDNPMLSARLASRDSKAA